MVENGYVNRLDAYFGDLAQERREKKNDTHKEHSIMAKINATDRSLQKFRYNVKTPTIWKIGDEDCPDIWEPNKNGNRSSRDKPRRASPSNSPPK